MTYHGAGAFCVLLVLVVSVDAWWYWEHVATDGEPAEQAISHDGGIAGFLQYHIIWTRVYLQEAALSPLENCVAARKLVFACE